MSLSLRDSRSLAMRVCFRSGLESKAFLKMTRSGTRDIRHALDTSL